MIVRYFAAAADAAQVPSEYISPPDPHSPPFTPASLRALLLARHPALANILPHSLLAVQLRFVDWDDCSTLIPDSAEVAVVPPVSGG